MIENQAGYCPDLVITPVVISVVNEKIRDGSTLGQRITCLHII